VSSFIRNRYHDNKNFLCNCILNRTRNDLPRTPLFYLSRSSNSRLWNSFPANGDYSFHHIKGIRDIFFGIIICAFVLLNERRPLGLALLAGTIIPINDLLIVLSKSYNGVLQAMPHIIAIIICSIFGVILLVTKTKKQTL